jgi:aminoglycoside 9-adenylyltransferase
MKPMPSVTVRISDHFDGHNPGGLIGLYLYGSSIAGGLRHESDVDLLVVTRRSFSTQERCEITDLLLRFSGRGATVAPGRPVELTSVVHSELTPWSYPPVCDYQYGEWLRGKITAGQLPAPHPDPDLAILITAARSASEALRGPTLDKIIDRVPTADVRRAIRDSLQPLVGDLDGDGRNVILTLARMIVTLETGEIVPKDEAASRVMSRLPPACQEVLELARHGYLGEAADDWTQLRELAQATAERLASHVRGL